MDFFTCIHKLHMNNSDLIVDPGFWNEKDMGSGCALTHMKL